MKYNKTFFFKFIFMLFIYSQVYAQNINDIKENSTSSEVVREEYKNTEKEISNSFPIQYALIPSIGITKYFNGSNSNTFSGLNASILLLMDYSLTSYKMHIIFGPGIKFESLHYSGTVTDSIVKYDKDENINSLQISPEIGIRLVPISTLSFYATFSYNYGLINTLDVSIANESQGNIPNQKLKANVRQNWNTGLNLRGYYNLSSKIGIGGGIYMGTGSLKYDSALLKTYYSNYSIATDSGSINYNTVNLSLGIVYHF